MNESYNYFMEADLKPFAGQWIAIVDQEVVSHGKNVKKVFEVAKKKFPHKDPLVTRVPGAETMIL